MTTRGHVLDANTIGLWRLNDPSIATVSDESGRYPLNQAGSPFIVTGLINDGGTARQFLKDGDAYLSAPTIAGLGTFFQGEFTIELWIKIDKFNPTSAIRMVSVGDGTGAAHINFVVNNIGGLRFFWADGGSGVSFDDFATPMALRTNYHVAMKKRSVGGGLYAVDLFINGIKINTSGSLVNTTGGTAATLAIGSGFDTALSFLGSIDDVRISKVARTDAEILASYQRGIIDFITPISFSSFGHKKDLNTLALWRLDETTSIAAAADATGVYNLPVGGGNLIPVPGLVPDSGLAKLFPGVVASSYIGAGNAAMGTALLGEWTIEAWIRIDAFGSAIDSRIIDIQDATRRYVWFSISAVGRLEVFWHSGAGVSQFIDEATTTLVIGTVYHVAAKKVSLGGGNYRVDFFVNGLKISSSASTPNSSASGAPTSVTLGSGVGGAPFFGIIDDVRISKILRTDAEIFESYRRGSSSQIRGIAAQGHKLDANTLALWRLDETASGAAPIDASGRINLSAQAGVIAAPALIADGGVARTAGAMQTCLSPTLVGIDAAAIIGEITFEGWLLPAISINTRLFAAASSGKEPFVIFVNTAGSLVAYWDNLVAGDGGIAFFSPTGLIQNNVRYHIGVRRSFVGGVWTLAMFVNGVKVLSSSSPTAPTAVVANFYALYFGNTTLDDVRISKVARTDAEIAESYWRGVIDKSDLSDFSIGPILDSNTVALWRLNEGYGDTGARDETGVYPLTTVLGVPSVVPGRVKGARSFDLNVGFFNSTLPDNAPDAILKTGNFTGEAWFWIDPSIGYPATWPLPGNNHAALFSYANNIGTLFMFGLGGTGFFYYNVTAGMVEGGSWANVKTGTWHHLAVRSTSTGATTQAIEIFLDGVIVYSAINVLKVTGVGAFPNWAISGESVGFNSFKGRIDDVRFSKVSRTNDEIFQSFHRPDIIYDLQSPAALRGTDRLLQQYKDATAVGVREVVAEGSNEVQDVNDAFTSFDSQLNVATATGKPLELLGKLVGEYRQGRSDDVYRLWVSAKVRANRSNGTIEDINDIFRILTNGIGKVQVIEYQPARILVKVNGFNVTLPNEFFAILRLARKAGVAYNLEYSTSAYGFGFRFAGGVAGGGKGFPDALLTPGSGGKLAGAK